MITGYPNVCSIELAGRARAAAGTAPERGRLIGVDMTSVPCAECGAYFEQYRRTNIYCSRSCRSRASYARQPQQWHTDRVARQKARERLKSEIRANDKPLVRSLPAEVWRAAPGFRGRYEVSSLGRIKRSTQVVIGSDGRRCVYGESLVRTRTNPDGYVTTCLVGETKRQFVRVHQLVCAAWHGPRPTPEHQTRHLNGIPDDNRPENLMWGTASENTYDRVRHGTHLNSRKTHCKRGHEFTPENTKHEKNGKWARRICRTCQRDRQRANYGVV